MSYSITWERTVIGGETAPGDFIAIVEGETIGRIFPHISGWRKDAWEWSFQLGHGEFRKAQLRGIEDSKQGAANQVKEAFARWIEYPEEKGGGKDLPVELWPHGANRLAWRAKHRGG
ncbi:MULTISPECIES: hypothetical protein [unclassified Phyllobacterium]|uniref:hypothetical protein n=1 Tax=unclassified Phyllobacterium TaxID=2638441 RepID=UPI00301311AF